MAITFLLTAILLISLGAALLQAADTLFVRERRSYRRNFGRDRLLVGLAVLFLYAVLLGFVAVLYIFSGYHPAVLYVSLSIPVAAGLVAALRACWNNRDSIDRRCAVLLVLWFAAVLFLTLFSRIGGAGTAQVWNTPFHSITNAWKQGTLQPLGDFFRNILLFVPIGFLVPGMNPGQRNKISFSVLGGVILSTVIESVQLLTGLGCCDLDDIIANSLGALVGYLVWLLVHQVRKNWRF